jgi:cell wall-associated NlpC family hydrolase
MRFRALAAPALVLAGSLALPVSRAYAAPTIPPAPPAGALASVRAEVAQLEADITADNQREQVQGERYDRAQVQLQLATAQLATLKVQVAKETVKVNTARTTVQKTAVADYVLGSSFNGTFGELLTGKVADSSTFAAYAQVATHALQTAVNSFIAAQTQLTREEGEAVVAQSQSSQAVGEAATAQSLAAGAAAQLRKTLSTTSNQVAEYVAEQAAHDAAVAAAHRQAAAALAAETVVTQIAAADPAEASTAAAATLDVDQASSASEPPITPAGTNALGNEAVREAKTFLGIPYVWGGASRSGVDCSGLTMLSWQAAGVSLLHSAWYQYNETKRITLKQLEPGDLLFYYFPDDGSDPVTHVAMYVGSGPYGTQTIIQAPETGETVSYAPIYYYGLVGEGRPAAAGTGTPGASTTTTTTTPTTTTTVPGTTTTVPVTTTTVAPPTTTAPTTTTVPVTTSTTTTP